MADEDMASVFDDAMPAMDDDDMHTDDERPLEGGGSGKGKGRGKGKKKTKKRPVPRSRHAGLQFPVGRIVRLMRQRSIVPRIGEHAAVFTTAVLEYLAAEILELSGNAARDFKRTRIDPRRIALAIRSDEDLNDLLKGSIARGGVLPHIQSALLPKGKKKKSRA